LRDSEPTCRDSPRGVINLSVFVRTKGIILLAMIIAAIWAFLYFQEALARDARDDRPHRAQTSVIGAILTKAAIAR
jgi:type II secretory pathway component PulF